MQPVDDDVRRMVRRLPGVSDRTLLELVNGLGVARGITADRAEQGVVARLFAQLTGSDHKAQLMTFRALVDGQQALVELSTEAAQRAAVTDLALARVATHLRYTRDLADATALEQRRLADVAEALGEYIRACDERIAVLEQWRASVDLRLAADDVLAGLGSRAKAGHGGVPWPVLAVLMARELAAGVCGRWEAQAGPAFRVRVADVLLAALREVAALPDRGFPLETVLDDGWRALRTGDHRRLLAELLDAGLDPRLALVDRPLTATVALTMELASLPDTARPERPARIALELSRRRTGWVDGGATISGFVKRAVGEQFDLAAQARRRWEGTQR
ncbi:hypothetical protein ACFFX1_39675 [Dactylosporangium sucinum]|uniref:Uncharacterized protein n=1 Tax=Dactylosporangium sucinum TaxID=1424081 RepID=A0A917SXG4_9ACTN|nr:hypothetical protein [Dactylosporangium sucinum]GGM02771.1 hypothetical protein GCM10007977_000190 [Dactylosporangium sucinum]